MFKDEKEKKEKRERNEKHTNQVKRQNKNVRKEIKIRAPTRFESQIAVSGSYFC